MLTGNIAAHNGYDGFAVYSGGSDAGGNQLRWNMSLNNGWAGFALWASTGARTLFGNVLSGNVAIGDKTGFYVASSGNLLTGNMASKNRFYGFSVWEAVGNTLRGNISRWNASYDAADWNPVGSNTWQGNWFGTTYGF